MPRRKRVNTTRLLLLIVVLLAAITTAILSLSWFLGRSRLPEVLTIPVKTVLETGKRDTIQKAKDGYYISVFVPKTGNTPLDVLVRKDVEAEIALFEEKYKEYKPEEDVPKKVFFGDFETYANGTYVSVLRYQAEMDEGQDPELIFTQSYIYDEVTKKNIVLDDLFEGPYLQKIAAIARQELKNDERFSAHTYDPMLYQGTKAIPENYTKYFFDDNNLIVIFAPGQLFEGSDWVYLPIPMDQLTFYLKANFTGTIALAPSDTQVNFTRYIDPDKPMIALTFDDGPNYGTTDVIIEALAQNDCAATFFVVGNRIKGHSSLILSMIDHGYEIGSHSYDHSDLAKKSMADVNANLAKAQDALWEIADYQMTFIRPPYGSISSTMRAELPYPMILWSLDTLDWRDRDAEMLKNNILSTVKDGDIILMHDLYESTAYGISELIPILQEQGYQLVTVSELFEYRGVQMVNGKAYGSVRP